MALDRQRFFERFQTQHAAFLDSIQGLPSPLDRERYTSRFLLRLMFIYFIQRKSFLDDNRDYLSSRLKMVQELLGPNQFFCFYRYLLLRLFHPSHQRRNPALDALMGNIPFLNSSLVATCELSQDPASLHIPDDAFAHLFTFFDAYHWQLDEPSFPHHDNTITPDVIGSLFEKYINQRQMGAYYTSEDVTSYISRYTIIPHLFKSTQQKYGITFQNDGPIWSLLRSHPDRYIPTTLRSEHHLPGETEREYQIRQTRYTHLKTMLLSGAITSIQAFITHNLDITCFAQDVLQSCEDPALLRSFYESLAHITILDPTCGTGAFLFAALNLITPLYAACLTRMGSMVTDATTSSDRVSQTDIALFHTILTNVARYPNPSCFILETIITHNLYGVDIMPEAIEICTLRLFLKFVASLSTPTEAHILPTLTFNLHSGNALIGFTTIPMLYKKKSPPHAILDLSLARTYGIDGSDSNVFQQWRASHQPFHWSLAFPQIMELGGFDVIIGNPPYVEYSKTRQAYQLPGYKTTSCGNLYAAVIERSLAVCKSEQSYLGLIVPLSICSGDRFEQLRHTIITRTSHLWLANFEIFPCRLFHGAFQRVSILLAEQHTAHHCATYVTRIQRWYAHERPHLLDQIAYTATPLAVKPHVFPKLSSSLQEVILHKMLLRASGKSIASALSPSRTAHFVYYQEATNYWMKATCRVPFYKKNGVVMEPAHGRFLYFGDERPAKTIMALMNSSLFYLWFATYSDGFHLSHTLVKEFPIEDELYLINALHLLSTRLEDDIQTHARMSTRNTRLQAGQHKLGHQIELEEYRMNYAKPLLDEIDQVLASHYGFTPEELDFIIHYDIKYRMGRNHNGYKR